MITLILIAVGLSMDACAVSIASGLRYQRMSLRDAGGMAFSFGVFQAGMPLLGWLAGSKLSSYLADLDHWVALMLLCVIGLKMIFEAFKKETISSEQRSMSIVALLALSVATSIDALAVGITMAFLNFPIFVSVAVIGTVTFVISLGGFLLGRRTGQFLRSKVEIAGGLLLITIGIKIVLEHTFL